MEPKKRPLVPPHIRATKFVAEDPQTGCWNWTGALSPAGYGRFGVSPTDTQYAHRFMYERHVGPIPKGMHTDHLCRNRRCCNPEHLEIVESRTNILRGVGPSALNAVKTHCPKGHEYTEENTYRGKSRGDRLCRTCRKEHSKRQHARARERRNAQTQIRDLDEAA